MNFVPGDKLEPLYAPIRHKLANALNNWHPSDSSAKVILQPWVNVFKAGHMEGFLVKNIVPKLELCMQEFVINPHQQILGKCFFFLLFVKGCLLSRFTKGKKILLKEIL